MSIILASKSPRRQELLHLLGVDFTIETADIDEHMDPALPAKQEVMRVSALKAAKIADLHPDDLVIASDTIVVVDGKILGKPRDEADAFSMLRLLSGRGHEVMTGLCVRQADCEVRDAVITKVFFRELSDAEIRAYIATGEPMDKAGAYGIQGKASIFVTGIEGDYFSVMGLPVSRLCQVLRTFGIPVLDV
ncbi:MAG: Maf family protein [Clostridia bacterium]|nr:Maf family protein [Clostridia bacterium]